MAKEALLADDPNVFFTTPHFDGYPAVLVQLERIGAEDLEEVIVEAWLARAPTRLAKEYGAVLIPKRILAEVIRAPGATLDGIHLSPTGHAALAAAVDRMLSNSN